MKNKSYVFCSKEEASERHRICDVHILECTDDTADIRLPLNARVIDKSRACKKFTRSGSSDLHKTYEPRTLLQLDATIQYLLHDIWWCSHTIFDEDSTRNRGGISSAYTFVMDRLQAVRQDIISECMFLTDPFAVINMFQSIVHFYIQSMHVITSHKSEPEIHSTSENFRSHHVSLATSSWFDLYSHESSLSSCLTTAIGFCQQLPLESRHPLKGYPINNIYSELNAYSNLLSIARQLRHTFQDIYDSKSNDGMNVFNSSPMQNTRTIAAIIVLCANAETSESATINLLEMYTAGITSLSSNKSRNMKEYRYLLIYRLVYINIK
jgi:hypothetical protein